MLDGAIIKGIERIEESLIGRNAKVVKASRNKKFLKLNVGDYSEVEL